VPIVVQCGDAASRQATTAVLRRALRDAQRVLGHLPAVRLRLRVLATAGSPPNFNDLGQVLAVWQVRELATGPLAVITLAATVDGRRLDADHLVVALAAALDTLDGWRPGQPATWILPATRRPAGLATSVPTPLWRVSARPTDGPPLPPAVPPDPVPAPSPLPDDPLGLGGH
jgi:hypothetical protein